jgi:hypothetical protein
MGEARRRKAAGEYAQTQVIVEYEDQPYVKIDGITTEDVLRAIRQAFPPPLPSSREIYERICAMHTALREDVANIRDYGLPECDDGRFLRDLLIVVEHALSQRDKSMKHVRAVILNYRAGQNPYAPERPSFSVVGLGSAISNEEFLQAAPTKHAYISRPDGTMEKITKPPRGAVGVECRIAGFWRNDQPNGICIKVAPNPDPQLYAQSVAEIRLAAEAIDLLVADYIAADRSQSDCLRILEAFAARGRDAVVPIPEAVQIMATISYMEDRGWLVSDEFNGMQWFYVDATGATEIRGDKPPRRHSYH